MRSDSQAFSRYAPAIYNEFSTEYAQVFLWSAEK